MLISIMIGINIIDFTYAFKLSENGILIVTDINVNKLIGTNDKQKLENIDLSNLDIITIDLKEDKYKDDSSVLHEKCKCFSCKTNYTKAYINHLFKCNELNGHIILLMHNIYMLENLIRNFEKIDEKSRSSALINFLKDKCEIASNIQK